MSQFRKSTLTSGAQSPFRFNARDQALYTNLGLEQEVEEAPHNQIIENGVAPMEDNGYNPFNGDLYSFDDEQKKDLSGFITTQQADNDFDAEGTPVDSIEHSTSADAPEFTRTNVFKNYGASTQMATPQELGLEGEDEPSDEVGDESVYFAPKFGNSRYAQAVNNVEGDGEFGAFGATLITPKSTASKNISTTSKNTSTASKNTSTASKNISTASKNTSTAIKSGSSFSNEILKSLSTDKDISNQISTLRVSGSRRVSSLVDALKHISIDNEAANKEVIATVSQESVEKNVFEFETQEDAKAIESLINLYNSEASKYIDDAIVAAGQVKQLIEEGKDVDPASSASYVDQMSGRFDVLVELYNDMSKEFSNSVEAASPAEQLEVVSNLELSASIKGVMNAIVNGVAISGTPVFTMNPVSRSNPNIFEIKPVSYAELSADNRNQKQSLENAYESLIGTAERVRNASTISLDEAINQLITGYTSEYYSEDFEPFVNALVESIDYINSGRAPISAFSEEVFKPVKTNNINRAHELFLALVDINNNHPDGNNSAELTNLIDRATFLRSVENYPSEIQTEAQLQNLVDMVDGLLVLFRTPSLEEKFGRQIVVRATTPTDEAIPRFDEDLHLVGGQAITYLANGFVASDTTGVNIIGRVEGDIVREVQDIMVEDEVYYVTLPLSPIEEVFVYDENNQLVDIETLNTVRMAILAETGEDTESPEEDGGEDSQNPEDTTEFGGDSLDSNVKTSKSDDKSSMTPWIIGGSAVAILAGAFIWHKKNKKNNQ